MAISLINETVENKRVEFPIVEFDLKESLFLLKSSDELFQFAVEYKPKIDQSFESKDFEIFFFSNQYLNAENDVFEIYEKELNKRIGWVFPIQVLESNENDFCDNIYFNKYKYSAFKKLLSENPTKKQIYFGESLFHLTDFYHENIIVFVLSKETLGDNVFSILSYLPSFSNYGYYVWNEGHHQFFAEQQSIALKKRGQKRITIQKSNLDISQNQFLSDLYNKHLKSINHFLLKFYFLYQVIEYLMEENFDSDFSFLVDEYRNDKLSKNDLKERINSITKERKSISSLFEKVTLDNDLKVDFIRDCKLLLDNFYSSPPNQIGDLLYDTRNLVVHRYREIMKDENNVRTLELITHQLELIINDLIISYSPQQAVIKHSGISAV